MKHPEKVEILKEVIDNSGKRIISEDTPLEKIDEQLDVFLNLIVRTPNQILEEEYKKGHAASNQPGHEVRNYY